MFLRTLFILFTCCFISFASFAQGIKPNTSLGFIYNRETTLNLKVHTNKGFAVGVEMGRLRTYYKTTFFQINVGEIKHPKEQRQGADPTLNRAFRPYIFGKQNNFFVARSGWGLKRYYSEKAKHKGVALGIAYSFGPSLGILKPYYLALRRSSPDNPGQSRAVHEKYSDNNKDIFLDNTRILGASPFNKGFKNLNFLPGGNASFAVHMDWGAFDEYVKALEIGVMVDAFPKNVPILVSTENSPLFVNFFVNLQFGKRK
jgi:hypothetical protein